MRRLALEVQSKACSAHQSAELELLASSCIFEKLAGFWQALKEADIIAFAAGKTRRAEC